MWVTGCEWLPADAVAALIRDGRAAGLAVLVGAGPPAAATEVAELAGLAGALLVHRIADPSLALALGSALAAASGRRPAGEAGRAHRAAGQRPAVARAGRVRAGGERAATSDGDARASWCRPGSRDPPPRVRSASGGGCAMTPRDPDGPLYLGWEYATPWPDPGPPPRRPVPQQWQPVSADWLAAQRREESLIDRPLKIIVTGAVALALALGACVAAGLLRAIVAAPTIAVFLLAAAAAGYAIWQGKRVLRGRIEEERQRVERLRADQESRHFAGQAEHARLVSRWQRRRSAFETQKRWYGVPVPAGIDRVDVAGAPWAAGRRC